MGYDWGTLVKAKKFTEIKEVLEGNPALVNEPDKNKRMDSLLMLLLERKKSIPFDLVEFVISLKNFNPEFKNARNETNIDAIFNSPSAIAGYLTKHHPEYKDKVLAKAKAELAEAVEFGGKDSIPRRDSLRRIIAAHVSKAEEHKEEQAYTPPKVSENRYASSLSQPQVESPSPAVKKPAQTVAQNPNTLLYKQLEEKTEKGKKAETAKHQEKQRDLMQEGAENRKLGLKEAAAAIFRKH